LSVSAVFMSNVGFSFCVNRTSIDCSSAAVQQTKALRDVFAVKAEWIAMLCV